MTRIIEGSSLRINATLVDDNGTAINLTGASSIVIHVVRFGGTELELSATVVSATAGTCYADLTTAQVVGVGQWKAWAEAVISTGETCKTLAHTFLVVSEGTTA